MRNKHYKEIEPSRKTVKTRSSKSSSNMGGKWVLS